MKLTSLVNEENRFGITLPGNTAEKDAEESKAKLLNLEGNVLVVDDEEEIRFLLRDIFEEKGLTVIEAVNGKEALDFCKQKKFDYIFTDLKMPEMMGSDFIRELDATESSSTPVFMVTAAESDLPRLGGNEVRERISHIIAKPFSSSELIAVILEHLDKKKKDAA